MVDLGTLGEQAASSFGNAINSAGQVAGGSWIFVQNETSDIHAFVQSGSEAMLEIAGNQGPGIVVGAAINDADQVTGTFATRDFTLPYLYTPATGAVLLSEPAWEFASGAGHGLNAKGQVVGMVAHYAFLYSGNAFTNWALMLGGLALLGAAMRRRPASSLLGGNFGPPMSAWWLRSGSSARPAFSTSNA
jgi:hypothetical protein